MIPPAKYTPESWLGSPARARAVEEAGIRDPVMSEKLRSVFYSIDTAHNRYIPYTTLRDYFLRYDIPWTPDYLGDYYYRTGNMTYDDWVIFAQRYPRIIDSLYYRPRGVVVDSVAAAAVAAKEAEVSVARAQREAELRSYYTSYSAERARIDAEYRARQASADAAAARAAASAASAASAAASAAALREELLYRPLSPRFGYL
eukprot:TRINITY_DN65120_c0_g1_i1.p1 TRINITY_DN65120_c0_g1~~TRINITY_DN65120_c0_g1_i1.p1  ORF type:complete len:209 (+),score=43.15 TRINITY_DN65120_c0_g1_i1:23-628(+)